MASSSSNGGASSLQPIEFSDCLDDGPSFRTQVAEHAKAHERLDDVIKALAKATKGSLDSQRQVNKFNEALGNSLEKVDYTSIIGSADTAAEKLIAQAFGRFADTIMNIESFREMSHHQCSLVLTEPLEAFRAEEIQRIYAEKKKFEKTSNSYYSSLERSVSASKSAVKKGTVTLDDERQKESQTFLRTSMDYVESLNSLQQKKKFEFVERLLGYMYQQMTFFHQAYDAMQELEPYMKELTVVLQNTRDVYEEERGRVIELKRQTEESMTTRMLNAEEEAETVKKGTLFMSKSGYKGKFARRYIIYTKARRTMQIAFFKDGVEQSDLPFRVTDASEVSIDVTNRRFCFECTAESGKKVLLQAATYEEMCGWMKTITDGQWVSTDSSLASVSVGSLTQKKKRKDGDEEKGSEWDHDFVEQSCHFIEENVGEQGIYRVSGVKSRVQQLVDKAEAGKFDFVNVDIHTATGALKLYLRSMDQPLLTHKLHEEFLEAGKIIDPEQKEKAIRACGEKMPPKNRRIFKTLCEHLKRVAIHEDRNRMSVANLAVVFGPTLMRPKVETMNAIVNIKYQNLVVEDFISNPDWIMVDTTGTPGVRGSKPKKDITSMPTLGELHHHDSGGQHDQSFYVKPSNAPPTPTRPMTTGSASGDKKTKKETPRNKKAEMSLSASHDSHSARSNTTAVPKPSKKTKIPPTLGRQCRALYDCVGDDYEELTFKKNNILTNVVVDDVEGEGWVVATLNGVRGLVPCNYIVDIVIA